MRFLKLFSLLLLHADFTFGRMNGKPNDCCYDLCRGDTVFVSGAPKKGEEGVEGSPLEFYGRHLNQRP